MSSPRPVPTGRPPARLDGERSRTRILDAAEQLLGEKGFSGTGIAAISRASGLPASSIYWFFANKRELMLAVIERSADRFLTELEATGAARRGLAEMFEIGLSQFGSRLPDFLRLRFLLALERGDMDPELKERLQGTSERIHNLAAEAIETSLGGARDAAHRSEIEALAPIAIALANGVLLAAHLEPDSVDISQLPKELEVAVRAVAEHRLGREGRK